jgi:hypothetical protein
MFTKRDLNGTTLKSPAASLKLVVTAHFVRTRRVGGSEQMLYNLIRGFSARDVDATILCGRQCDLSEDFLAEVRDMPTAHVRESGGTGPRFVAEQRACMERDVAGGAVLFPNYYVPPYVPRRLGRIGVVMHDFQ